MNADLAGQTVFSFGELGFQEFETSKYLTTILQKAGFKVARRRGPTASNAFLIQAGLFKGVDILPVWACGE